jgi:hypothetical protein
MLKTARNAFENCVLQFGTHLSTLVRCIHLEEVDCCWRVEFLCREVDLLYAEQ